ncbi:hypothetical protein GEMRC1_009615 [Eukaryota sp. GEM-RC1]
MYYPEPPMKTGRSLDNNVTDIGVVQCSSSPSSISSSFPTSNASSSGPHAFLSPSTHLHFQKSLLSLVHLHFLSHFLEHSLEWNRRDLLSLKVELPTFFKKVGYVSSSFL